jgi:glutathione peroxidase
MLHPPVSGDLSMLTKILVTLIVALAMGTLLSTTSQADQGSPLTGTVKKIDGTEVDLASYKGKVVLIVNVASRCGLTPQYTGLQKLYDTYKDKGLVILGFPANEFGAQEPGADSEIATFCSSKYGVTFDMFSKIVVKGPGIAPLYKTLTESSDPKGDIGWNFEKFLIGRDGKIAGRYSPRTAPDDAALKAAIEAALAKAG